MPSPPLPVLIRPVTAADEASGVSAALRAIWRAGFYEIAPFSYARIAGSPLPLAACLSLAALALFAARSRAAAGALALLGAAVYTPAGRALHDALLRAAVARQERATMHALAEKWRAPRAAFFVAEDAATRAPLGCVGVKLAHTLAPARAGAAAGDAAREASVWRLAVAPAARGRGVARALMAAAEEWARAGGAARVSLICGNPESARAYRAMGYGPEAVERARLALYGPSGRARGAAGLLLRGPLDAALRARCAATIFAKEL